MRIGIYQPAGAGLSIEQRLAGLKKTVEAETQEERPDLVLCPELFISGYAVADALHESASASDGEAFQQVSALAQDLGIAIVYGYPEKGDSCLYNSTGFVSKNGTLVANHRKRLNAPGGYEDSYFTVGDQATLIDYEGYKIAILICYEVEFPELVREAAMAGAEIVLVPTALGDEWGVVAVNVIATRAFENGVWLAYANHAGTEGHIHYLGGSRIVAPDGKVATEAGADETLIACRVDKDSIERAQTRLPYLRDVPKLK